MLRILTIKTNNTFMTELISGSSKLDEGSTSSFLFTKLTKKKEHIQIGFLILTNL